MGEKFGHDNIWESHLATEINKTSIPLEAVLDELKLPLRQIMNLEVGETVTLNSGPDDPIQLRCGGITLVTGTMGRAGSSIAVRVARGITKANTQKQQLRESNQQLAEAV
jgi:flagellar motor switch protein FliM